MKAAIEIKAEKTKPSETSVALSKPLSTPLAPSSVKALGILVAQTAAYFPHQPITAETATVWTARWTELIQEYSLEVFTDALSKVVHSSEFFPLPAKIEAECKLIRREVYKQEFTERMKREAEASLLARQEAERRRKEHPEEFITMSTIYQEFISKRQENQSS